MIYFVYFVTLTRDKMEYLKDKYSIQEKTELLAYIGK